MTHRLSIRIALVVFLMALLGALATSALFYERTLNTEREATRRILMQLGQTVQGTASIAAYLDNQEIAQDVLEGLGRNAIVAGVGLTSVTGMNLRQGSIDVVPAQGGLARLTLMSPFTPGEAVGELRILPRHEHIEANARQAALERAMSLAGYTLLVALIVMILIQHLFVRALEHLATSLHDLVPGGRQRLSHPPRHARSEIGGLVDDINRLLDLVNEKLDSERALRAQVEAVERRFRLIFERASVGICLLGARGDLIMANPAFRHIVGSSACDEARGEGNCLVRLFEDAPRAESLVDATRRGRQLAEADLRLAGPAGAERWVHCLFSRGMGDTSDQGEAAVVQVMVTDITERKRQEHLIRFQAEHDSLTQLHNRRSVEAELGLLLARARAEQGCIALCLIDLDDFKPVNDTFGHEAGDHVLVTIAARLRQILRQNDLAARLGGDEFLVAIPCSGQREAVDAVARKLMASLAEPIDIGEGRSAHVGISMGIVLSNEQEGDFTRLMALADQAMYQVKHRGKNGFQIYEST
jgi:diguanylate cyclase (GGDEF)-like protein/PAS domain S-box-containing protein